MVAQYRMGGTQKREACESLLQQIYIALRSVTVNVADYETLQVIQAARRLYQPSGMSMSMSQKLEITRRFAEGYTHYKELPRVQLLVQKVLNYNRLLRAFYMGDHQVAKTQISPLKAVWLLLFRLGQLAFLGVCTLPGLVLNAPIILVSAYMSKRKALEALRGSSVKISGRDVISTWKILIASIVVPVVYLTYAGVYCLWISSHPSLSVFLWILCIYLPVLSLSTVGFYERATDLYKSLAPLWTAIVHRHHSQQLRVMRWELQNEIIGLVNDLAPQIFPNFEKERMVPKRAVYLEQQDEDDDWLHWKEVSSDEQDDDFFKS
jgi:glycerol-3-phosphate O-acyltransferase/dihydroxyacetone phosphate acyltransferase